MRQADAYVIADPPPFAGDHRADLSSIMGAAEAIAGVLRGGEVFMI
jgi:UDP-N-acetyl-D-mannosaminuronate dehydrogenase